MEGLRSPLLIALQAYWDGKRIGKAMPSRRDLDPIEIPPVLLPHLKLLDVEPEGRRFRYRLVGTGVAADYGRDTTGRYIDELEEPLHAGIRLADFYGAVATERRPKRLCGWLQRPDGEIAAFEYLALPLSADGRTVDMIFCGLDSAEVD